MILGREKAIDVNLEQIRCIITSDEVLLLNSLDTYVLQYVVELQRRLKAAGMMMFGNQKARILVEGKVVGVLWGVWMHIA
ncbi:putative magnesium transporter MRS2 [Helianthus anomalus]